MPDSSSWLKAVSLGAGIALFGLAILIAADGYTLEEHFGLDVLFRLRGPAPVPNNVVVVALEKSSSRFFGIPNDPTEWPRELHARLIDKLTAAGASTISFDIYFKKPRQGSEDQSLAKAMKRSSRVILFTHTYRETESLATGTDQPGMSHSLNIERLIPPIDILSNAAVSLAPFALPKYPLKVTGFWTYRVPAGDVPNMPAVTLQLYSEEAYAWIRQQLEKSDHASLPNMQDVITRRSLQLVMMQLRTLFNRKPDLAAELLGHLALDPTPVKRVRDQVHSLIELYSGKHRHYLNFYGPPWHIKTIPYHELLATPDEELDLKGKAVFIGFSERAQPEQLDNFNTVYSQPSGLDISGVEIAATAFANLLHRHTLKPLSPLALISLIAAFGFIISLLARMFKPALAISMGILLAVVYTGTSHYLFSHNIIWLPWVIPVLIQTPLTLFLALGWHYFDTHRDRKRIRQVFGLYLPDTVVDEITRQHGAIKTDQKIIYGVAMSSDAAQYTSLAENMEPSDLASLVNRYYELLFKPVRANDGIITDVIGDAMMALWTAPRDTASLHQNACLAALAIKRNIQQSNDQPHALSTRIGLHAGEISLGNVGAADHFEYRAVGDIINTTSRIEGLNKQLGTLLIASDEVIRNCKDLLCRELGSFRLAGKTQILVLHEIISLADVARPEDLDLCEKFKKGLIAYRNGLVLNANGIFHEILRAFPDDGPTRFYVELCSQHSADNTETLQDGVITLTKK